MQKVTDTDLTAYENPRIRLCINDRCAGSRDEQLVTGVQDVAG